MSQHHFVLPLASFCSPHSPETGSEGQETTWRRGECSGQLWESLASYPLVWNDVICVALEFFLELLMFSWNAAQLISFLTLPPFTIFLLALLSFPFTAAFMLAVGSGGGDTSNNFCCLTVSLQLVQWESVKKLLFFCTLVPIVASVAALYAKKK